MNVTRFLDAKTVKGILAEYIPSEHLSVRTRVSRRRLLRARGQVTLETSRRVIIDVRPGGVCHAWQMRGKIKARGFDVEFYGRAKGGRIIEPTSVRVTTQ